MRLRASGPLTSRVTAAAAARINAQLQARKGIQHVDVPPILSSSTATKDAPPANINGEMYISDGDYIKDIEVNDLRNRYLLTKSSTQKMVNDFLAAALIPHQLPCPPFLGGSPSMNLHVGIVLLT